MSDEQDNVDTGGETSSVETPVETTPEVVETPVVETPEVVETPVDAEVAAETPSEAPVETPSDDSRTGFAEKGLRAGDACTCPDGRTGTVHQYDAGLICMPNEIQG
jgi:hypothetical protein